jgi:hypothetical protein
MAEVVERADPDINESGGIPKPELGVYARPVDTYVRPVNAERSSLGQLAGALKELNPTLEKVEQRFQEQAEQQGVTAGTEAFQKDAGDWDKAVNAGDVPSILNPYARMKARETFGRLAGDKMGQDVQADQQYIRDNSNATTIQQHDDAWANARQRWEKEHLGHDSHNDPLFQLHYQTMAQTQTQDARNKALPEIEKNFVTINAKHLGDELTSHTSDMLSNSGDPGQIGAELSQIAASSGLPELLQRGALINAVDGAAHQRRDATIYNLAANVTIHGIDGKDYKLSDDPDFIDRMTKGQDEIVRSAFTGRRLENSERSAKQQATRADVGSQLAEKLEADPHGSIYLAQYEDQYRAAGIGDKIAEIPRMLAALRKGGGSTPAVLQALRISIDDGDHPAGGSWVTKGTIAAALSHGDLSMDDYKSLIDDVDKRDKKLRGRAGRKDTDPATAREEMEKGWISDMGKTFGTSKDFMGQTDTIQTADRGRATFELRRLMRLYVAAHTEGGVEKIDPDKYDEFLQKQTALLVDQFLPKGQGAIASIAKNGHAKKYSEELVKAWDKAETPTESEP